MLRLVVLGKRDAAAPEGASISFQHRDRLDLEGGDRDRPQTSPLKNGSISIAEYDDHAVELRG
jgi:hypothetical protein